MGMLGGVRGPVFSVLPSESPLEAAFILRRTGALVASWTREGVEADVMGVMAATMLASIDTLGGALGCPPSGRVTVETDHCRLLATRVEPRLLLVLLAPRTLDSGALQRETRRVLAEVPALLGRVSPPPSPPAAPPGPVRSPPPAPGPARNPEASNSPRGVVAVRSPSRGRSEL